MASPVTPTLDPAVAAELLAFKVQAAAQAAAMQEEIEKLRAQVVQQAIPMEVAGFDTCATDLKLESLPQLAIPEQEKLKVFGQVYCLLSAWSSVGASVPFTWADLQTHLEGDIDTVAMAKEVLGDTWRLWAGDAEVLPSAVVPQQMGIVIRDRLDTLRMSYEQLEQTKKDAARSFAVITEQSKKRRAAA